MINERLENHRRKSILIGYNFLQIYFLLLVNALMGI